MEYQDELERMRDRRRREKARQQRHVQHQHYEGALRKERTGRRERAYEERELEIIDFDNLEPAPSRKKKVKKRKKHRFLFWKFLLFYIEIIAQNVLIFNIFEGRNMWTEPQSVTVQIPPELLPQKLQFKRQKTGQKQTSSWLVRLFLSSFSHRAERAGT